MDLNVSGRIYTSTFLFGFEEDISSTLPPFHTCQDSLRPIKILIGLFEIR